MNGDGKLDLISGSYMPGDIYLFRGGPGGFDAGYPLEEPTPRNISRMSSAPSIADWDQDGKPDLLIGNMAGDVYWLRNENTQKTVAFGPRQVLLLNGKPLHFAAGDTHPLACDWDGDGVLDLLVGDGDGQVWFCKGIRSQSGPPTLTAPIRLRAGGKEIALGNRAKLCVCDWNNDGHPDLLVGDFEVDPDARDTKTQQLKGHVYLMLRQP